MISGERLEPIAAAQSSFRELHPLLGLLELEAEHRHHLLQAGAPLADLRVVAPARDPAGQCLVSPRAGKYSERPSQPASSPERSGTHGEEILADSAD